jgi:hypothetical protein
MSVLCLALPLQKNERSVWIIRSTGFAGVRRIGRGRRQSGGAKNAPGLGGRAGLKTGAAAPRSGTESRVFLGEQTERERSGFAKRSGEGSEAGAGRVAERRLSVRRSGLRGASCDWERAANGKEKSNEGERSGAAAPVFSVRGHLRWGRNAFAAPNGAPSGRSSGVWGLKKDRVAARSCS